MTQETPTQEAQREMAHWQMVIAKYSGKDNPLDKIMVEDATALYFEWEAKLEALDEAAADEAEGVTQADRAQ
jgi:hypothetical protein